MQVDQIAYFRGAFSTLLDADSAIDGSARSQLRLVLLLSKVLARDGAPMPEATMRAINAVAPGALAGESYADGAAAVSANVEEFRRQFIAKRELARLKEVT